jgi:RimJ/RimL family protein N-acetyltransferase
MDPLLINLPEQIDTPRLLLRVPVPGDGAIVHPSVCRSIDELNAWMPWAKRDYSLDDAESWCRRVRAEFYLRVQWQFILLDRASGAHLGNVGAHRFNWDTPSAEIGYWLRTDATGKGLMTEAVRAISDRLIEEHGFRRIEIRCDELNQRSAGVAERSGYELQARLRCHARDHHGSLRDTRIYAHVIAE